MKGITLMAVTLMGNDVLAHQHYLRQISKLANERAYTPGEIEQRFPNVQASYTDIHADYMRLQLKGWRPIDGDTVYCFVVENGGKAEVYMGLDGEFERS